jgi:hypothetical protein
MRHTLTTIVRNDKWNVHMLRKRHSPPLVGNFCDKHGKVVKLAIAEGL